ncbi:MAG: hypothetical protein LUE88_01985 [Clostridiales bacterium]|nr:hypothetical protein [Clostridiales bacterium]
MQKLSNYNNNIEAMLDEADRQAESTTERLSHEEVFEKVREALKKNKSL